MSVDLRDDIVDVDVTLVVEYGAASPRSARPVASAVRERIEAITGLTVNAVNVVVSDIDFPEEASGSPERTGLADRVGSRSSTRSR